MGQFKWAYNIIASNVQPDLLIHGQCVYTLVSYPTLSAGRHFIRHLPGSGKDWAQNCCTESRVDLIRQLITDSLIKNYRQVSHNASVKTHRSMQIEDRYEQFWDYPLGTPYRRRTDGGWLYQWFFAQGPCCLIAKWPWNRGYGKPVITTFLPGAIDHVWNKFGPLHLLFMERTFSAYARNVSSTRAAPVRYFNYINDIHVTTDDVTKGLIGLCQTRTVQRFWAQSFPEPRGRRTKWQPADRVRYETICTYQCMPLTTRVFA